VTPAPLKPKSLITNYKIFENDKGKMRRYKYVNQEGSRSKLLKDYIENNKKFKTGEFEFPQLNHHKSSLSRMGQEIWEMVPRRAQGFKGKNAKEYGMIKKNHLVLEQILVERKKPEEKWERLKLLRSRSNNS
jgi:hypothetical protein